MALQTLSTQTPDLLESGTQDEDLGRRRRKPAKTQVEAPVARDRRRHCSCVPSFSSSPSRSE